MKPTRRRRWIWISLLMAALLVVSISTKKTIRLPLDDGGVVTMDYRLDIPRWGADQHNWKLQRIIVSKADGKDSTFRIRNEFRGMAKPSVEAQSNGVVVGDGEGSEAIWIVFDPAFTTLATYNIAHAEPLEVIRADDR